MMHPQDNVNEQTARELALEGKDLPTQYKALHIAAKANIEADEPVWWIFVALGYIESLASAIPAQIDRSTQAFTDEFAKARRGVETAQYRYSGLISQQEQHVEQQHQHQSEVSSQLARVENLISSRNATSVRRWAIACCVGSFLAGFGTLSVIQAVFQPSASSDSESVLILSEFGSVSSFLSWSKNKRECLRQYEEGSEYCRIKL